MNAFLTLLLILQPLAPVTEIHLGELVPPISALKLKLNEPAPFNGAFLRPSDWIRLKTAIEGARPLCAFVVDETLSACARGIEREREISQQRSDEHQRIIDALKVELSREITRAESAEESAYRFKLATISLGAIATVSASLLYFCMR